MFAWVSLWFPLEILVFGMWQQRLNRRATDALKPMLVELIPYTSP